MLWIIPDAGAVRQEKLWDMTFVQIALNGGIGYIAQALKDECDLILFDKSPDLLDGFRRAVTVIQADEVDLAPINAAPVVDHPEVGKLGASNSSIRRNRSAVGPGQFNALYCQLHGAVGVMMRTS